MSAEYQNLFDYMYDEYGVILLQNEIQEIVRRVKLDEEQDKCNLPHVINAVCKHCGKSKAEHTTASGMCKDRFKFFEQTDL